MTTRSGPGWEGEIGGNCPVQGDGTADGHVWYFRARGERWAMHIAIKGEEDALAAGEYAPGWAVDGEYGVGTRWDAGYMPDDEVWVRVEKVIADWRAGLVPYFDGRVEPMTDEEREVAAEQYSRRILAVISRGVGGAADLEDRVAAMLPDARAVVAGAHERLRLGLLEQYGDGVPESVARAGR